MSPLRHIFRGVGRIEEVGHPPLGRLEVRHNAAEKRQDIYFQAAEDSSPVHVGSIPDRVATFLFLRTATLRWDWQLFYDYYVYSRSRRAGVVSTKRV